LFVERIAAISALFRFPRVEEPYDHLRIGTPRRLEFAGGVQCVALGVEDSQRGYAFLDRYVVLLHKIFVLVVAADVHVHDVVVLVQDRLNPRLVEAVIQGKAVKAPIGAEDQQHVLVVLSSRRKRFGDLLLCIGILGIELPQL